MVEELSLDTFLDRKQDYSPFLVHLTRDGLDLLGDPAVPAKDVLEVILDEKTLRAYHYFCLFQDDIASQDDKTKNGFKVVCFTETPIDQIEVLTKRVEGRTKEFEPYGLVFTKDYISEKKGNPAFYVKESIFDPFWKLYNDAKGRGFSLGENKILALVNKCDKSFDFHWEREWRIVGDLEFELKNVYCGFCPEEDISYFQKKHEPVKFISPYWGINKILDKLVKNK
jgi:hypothetical protein